MNLDEHFIKQIDETLKKNNETQLALIHGLGRDLKAFKEETRELIDLPPVFEIEFKTTNSQIMAEQIKNWIFTNCKQNGVKSLHINYYDK